jgi:hypothetical protein
MKLNTNMNINIFFIYVLIIIFLYIIITNLLIYYKKQTTLIEGLSVKKISKKVEKGAKKAGKKVEKGAKKAGKSVEKGLKQADPAKAIKELEKVIKKIQNDLKKIPKQIDDKILSKFTKFFTQLGSILNKGIVKPLETLFIGIGNIFVFLFQILKMIGDKIVSLPGCILYYIFDSILAGIFGTLRTIFQVLRLKVINRWIINPIENGINNVLDWIGYTDASRRCYAFNVNKEVDKMNNGFQKIDKEFKSNFGKLNFNEIKL